MAQLKEQQTQSKHLKEENNRKKDLILTLKQQKESLEKDKAQMG